MRKFLPFSIVLFLLGLICLTQAPAQMTTTGAGKPVGGITVPGGLVFYAPMDSSTLGTDIIGNDAGTLNGSPTQAAGQIENAYTFNGTSGFIEYASRVGPQSAMSLCAWINPTAALATGSIASMYSAGTASYVQWFALGDGTLFSRIQQSLDTIYIARTSNTGILTAGSWQHVVMTWDGGTTDAAIKSYKNSTQVDTTNGGAGSFTAASSASLPLQIAAQGGPFLSGFFKAAIDDVRMYNRALTAGEITLIYNAGLAGHR